MGTRRGGFLRRIVGWNEYDAAYQVWKQYKKELIGRHEALTIIGDQYGVRLFFLLYPIYKTLKPFIKISRKILDRLDLLPRVRIEMRGTLDSSKRTILLVSHDASQTGAPIIAFNLLEKFAERYNVISVLLGPGRLEDAFRNVSSGTIGPFRDNVRHTPSIHRPILDACLRFAPAFAIVNSIESRMALVPISEAGVPSVQLVHEFASGGYGRDDLIQTAEYASQIVFPARLVWEDAVSVFPPLANRPANVIPQGPVRIPREWLNGETAHNEEQRIAAVMRPLGAEDGAVVVMGCGVIDLRKGVDLFISAAAALKRRSPSCRFRFVWVGKGNPNEDVRFASRLAEEVNRSGLKEMVTFLEVVDCVDPAYAMADIFLLSSRLDPLPNVAIDAMLAGLPVVCFENCSGVAEMLSNHADLKRLVVPQNDVSSAAEVIEQLSVEDSYRRTAKAAIRDLALSAFNMDRYVERIEQTAQTAASIRRQEEDDFATINRSDVLIEEYAAPPGFRAPRDAYIRNFIREAAVWDVRCPFPGFHPGIYRNAHPQLTKPPFANPLAHFIRNGQPKGPWLLDIIRPESKLPAKGIDQRIALHLHIHYPELTPELLRPIAASRSRPDIFVTVSSEEARRAVVEKAAELGVNIEEITVVPNRGRDVGPLLTLLGRRLLNDYDIVGHMHSKKTLHVSGPSVGEAWRTFCLENLLGGKHAMLDTILEHFAGNPKLGLVFPCDPHACGWEIDRPAAQAILERIGITIDLPEYFFFPVGTMFWARTDAIAPLLQLGLTWSDYPIEPLPIDGTILHAIERLFPIVAQHRGFEIAGTYVPGVTR